MTMPHLMNCGHSAEGWCLDCVAEMGNDNLKFKELLFGRHGVISGLKVLEKNLQKAQKADAQDAPFGLVGDEARIYHNASFEAYRHALEMLNSESLIALGVQHDANLNVNAAV